MDWLNTAMIVLGVAVFIAYFVFIFTLSYKVNGGFGRNSAAWTAFHPVVVVAQQGNQQYPSQQLTPQQYSPQPPPYTQPPQMPFGQPPAVDPNAQNFYNSQYTYKS
jgi:hypothetical protein